MHIEINHPGPSLKRAFCSGFGDHGVEQKSQGLFGILAINAAIFLINHAAAVVHRAVQHQRGGASVRVNPFRFIDMFEVRRGYIKLPAVVAVFCPKTYGWGFLLKAGLVEVQA